MMHVTENKSFADLYSLIKQAICIALLISFYIASFPVNAMLPLGCKIHDGKLECPPPPPESKI